MKKIQLTHEEILFRRREFTTVAFAGIAIGIASFFLAIVTGIFSDKLESIFLFIFWIGLCFYLLLVVLATIYALYEYLYIEEITEEK